MNDYKTEDSLFKDRRPQGADDSSVCCNVSLFIVFIILRRICYCSIYLFINKMSACDFYISVYVGYNNQVRILFKRMRL